MTRRHALLAWALLAILGLRAAQEASVSCIPIVPRREWKALASERSQRLRRPVHYVVVSHAAGSAWDTPASCLKQVQNVQHYHVRTLGGCDVGYNFLMGEDRLQYEGRGWNTLGAHSGPTWNPIPLGISFMGNYMDRVPPPRAIRAAQSLLACSMAQGFLTPSYEVKGHRDVQMLSPGNQLYEIIQQWSHYHRV
ncbi:LOW QUALITY PROTEIN: peptidoglycan recognition protein 1 [Megaptera novaeangliae]